MVFLLSVSICCRRKGLAFSRELLALIRELERFLEKHRKDGGIKMFIASCAYACGKTVFPFTILFAMNQLLCQRFFHEI